jgi:hypothetical protein
MSPILAPIINQLLETFILSGIVAIQGVTNKVNTHTAARYKSAENKASLTCCTKIKRTPACDRSTTKFEERRPRSDLII